MSAERIKKNLEILAMDARHERELATARNEGREEGLVAGFADCEALVVAMLTELGGKELARAASAVQLGSPTTAKHHKDRSGALREAALAVQLGQHRTDAYDAEQIATAHRKAAWPNQVDKMNKARALALSPERQKEIALIASKAASTARRARAKGE